MIFQIDTTGLSPGDAITRGQCEAVIGFTEDTHPKDYQFALLQLLGVVQKQLKKEHGRELTVRIVGGELHVLTDQEAASYNPKRFEAGLRLARRSHRRLMAVKVSSLTPEDKAIFAKNVSNQAYKLSMLRKRAEVPLIPSERQTPKMTFKKRNS